MRACNTRRISQGDRSDDSALRCRRRGRHGRRYTVGAIGVSGAPPGEADDACAKKGIAAIGDDSTSDPHGPRATPAIPSQA
jgi:hypothetical protein